MATDFKSIPIIDIAPLLAKSDDPKMGQDPDVAQVVRQLDRACKEAGFFYVDMVFPRLLKQVKNLTRKFFELPYEEKLNIKMSADSRFRGYQRIGENITKGVSDMHEAIDCYKELKPGKYGDLGKPMEGPNQWPDNPPEFKVLMEEYISLCTGLSKKIMRGIALALGGSPYEFEGDRAGDAFWVMRLIGYPAARSTNSSDIPKNDVGCGAHTDYAKFCSPLASSGLGKSINPSLLNCCITGLLTLVNQDDDITALQVRNQSGEWISAPPVPGTFVCNIGDMLKIYSNGLYDSTLHQVINSAPKYRVCVAYFYETNFDTAVEPLDFCVEKTGGAKKFDRAVYGEHLVNKVQTNFG